MHHADHEGGVVTGTLSPKGSDSTEVVGTKGHFPSWRRSCWCEPAVDKLTATGHKESLCAHGEVTECIHLLAS